MPLPECTRTSKAPLLRLNQEVLAMLSSIWAAEEMAEALGTGSGFRDVFFGRSLECCAISLLPFSSPSPQVLLGEGGVLPSKLSERSFKEPLNLASGTPLPQT